MQIRKFASKRRLPPARRIRLVGNREISGRSPWLAFESLEPRELLAAHVYVNDNWVELVNASGGTPGVVEPGDIVGNSGDAGSLPVFGTFEDPSATFPAYASIQAAIDAVSVDGTVHVLAGSYAENVVIAKSLHLRGEDQNRVTVFPAFSSPDPLGGGSEPLPGGESNILLVQTDRVEISGISFDGDNPTLSTPGYTVDARNGITTEFSGPATPITDLNVHDVKVRNVYFRGIQNITHEGTFLFSNNTVFNVQGSDDSAGIYNRGGSGTISNNSVSEVVRGIATEESRGTTIRRNTVTNASAVGIGSYRNGASDASGLPDRIGGTEFLGEGNSITNGGPASYGILVLTPHRVVDVRGNTVTEVSIGLALLGSGPNGSAWFQSNKASRGFASPLTVGVIISNEDGTVAAPGEAPRPALLSQNSSRNFETGLLIQEQVSDTADTATIVRIGREHVALGINGVVLDGAVELENDSLGETIVSGQSNMHIVLKNGAYGNNNPTDTQRRIDATTVFFGTDGSSGFSGAGIGPGAYEILEPKLIHEPDDGTLGFLVLRREPQVEVVEGQLIITGSVGGESVSVTGIGAGTGAFQVVTGRLSYNVAGISDILIDLQGGHDTLTMNNIYVSGAIDIRTGDGNDTVLLGQQAVVSTGTELRVDLGAGNDTLDGKQMYIGTNQIINGGDGDDSLIFAGFASPEFTLGTSAGGNATWTGGNGNDLIYVRYAFIAGHWSVDSGAGNDSVDVFGSAVSGHVSLLGSAGSDLLRNSTNFFDASVYMDGGEGLDVLELNAGLGAEVTGVYGGASADSIKIESQMTGRLYIDAGPGIDNVEVRSSAFDWFFAFLGDDDDRVTVYANLSRLETDLDGGPGSGDRLVDLGNSFGVYRTRGFEVSS